ncbi:hypothetical protein RhiirB3_520690 [Rhizophagus irregularis]|nr:hypothetical protein RhiirB3_520690 [Rhizophagus irregularis]
MVSAAPPLINMLEVCDTNEIKILLDGEVSQIINYYDPREFENLSKTIGFGGSASVYTTKWMGTTTYAIKRFRNSFRDDIINEVYLMGKVNCHPNIIKICGVTTLEGETNYSLILEYADSGTLGEEKPSPSTNHKFIALYEKCWQHEPNTRPKIRQVISELEELNNNEPLVVSENVSFKEIETTLEISKTPENDEVNIPSYDCDINKYEL